MPKLIRSVFVLPLLALVLPSCAVVEQMVQKPTVHVEKVQYQTLSLEEAQLDSRIQLTNPNAFSLPIKSMHYTLRVNGRELASSTIALDRKIPANGSAQIQVPIKFRYRSLLEGLSSLLQTQQMHYQIDGELDLGLVSVSFGKSGEFGLRP